MEWHEVVRELEWRAKLRCGRLMLVAGGQLKKMRPVIANPANSWRKMDEFPEPSQLHFCEVSGQIYAFPPSGSTSVSPVVRLS